MPAVGFVLGLVGIGCQPRKLSIAGPVLNVAVISLSGHHTGEALWQADQQGLFSRNMNEVSTSDSRSPQEFLEDFENQTTG